MAKALDIIEEAYYLLGVKALNEPLDGAEAERGLNKLKALIDSWQCDPLFISSNIEFSQTVTGSPITIGTGQTLNTARPKFIRDTSFVRINSQDYQIQWVDQERFNSIMNKSISSNFTCFGYYDDSLPISKIYLWPKPVSVDLHLIFDATLPAFTDYTTDVTLDYGYLRALQYSLAEELAPGLREITPTFMKSAMNARRIIRINNTKVPVLESRFGRRMYNNLLGY